MAGIQVVASYEIWKPANLTNSANLGHTPVCADIRHLRFRDLPKNIDLVVGSPPCTEFSFSNRGGNGDIEDGLRDIIKFLRIVEQIQPRAWAMENVPRAAMIVERELLPGGRLRRFAHLGIGSKVYNMEEFGLPQRRKRSLIGNLDFELLSSYSEHLPRRTLGQVIRSLAQKEPRDPIYNIRVRREDLCDHSVKDFLDDEEIRINRSNKMLHPVYNTMSFPDRYDRSVRTITATCTRVSRESVVIEDPTTAGSYRRLTVRERACLQGFPITYQFFGGTYAQKAKMVGNAMPPLFAFYTGQALRGIRVSQLLDPVVRVSLLPRPSATAAEGKPDRRTRTYRKDRRFRFAIPSLRLKSGVRFELTNKPLSDNTYWGVDFYFGTSKSIRSVPLKGDLASLLLSKAAPTIRDQIRAILGGVADLFVRYDVKHMQDVWCHRGPGAARPFMLLDALDEVGVQLKSAVSSQPEACEHGIKLALRMSGLDQKQVGTEKLLRNSVLVYAGLLLGSAVNGQTGWLPQNPRSKIGLAHLPQAART